MKNQIKTKVVSSLDREMTLQEIADKLGISRQRAKQIEDSALKKLMSSKLKEQWLDIMDTLSELNSHKHSNSYVKYSKKIVKNYTEEFDHRQKY